jgi:hypothetical protein|tara:strand:+ start:222 stop:599 length:378 start_codon:yes stop_codon:yes gene_type:complete
MDSEQKFTEVKSTYEIEDWFYSQLSNYNRDEQTNIIGQFLEVMKSLPLGNEWTQETAGVVIQKEPLFFAIEYLKEENEPIVLVDLHELEVDEYLEFISNKKSIKSYYDGREERAHKIDDKESSRI